MVVANGVFVGETNMQNLVGSMHAFLSNTQFCMPLGTGTTIKFKDGKYAEQ